MSLVRCPVAINYCSLSPSGRYLLCVGDNRHAYLYEATGSGEATLSGDTKVCLWGFCYMMHAPKAWPPGPDTW